MHEPAWPCDPASGWRPTASVSIDTPLEIARLAIFTAMSQRARGSAVNDKRPISDADAQNQRKRYRQFLTFLLHAPAAASAISLPPNGARKIRSGYLLKRGTGLKPV
jgi:hypothetical protein